MSLVWLNVSFFVFFLQKGLRTGRADGDHRAASAAADHGPRLSDPGAPLPTQTRRLSRRPPGQGGLGWSALPRIRTPPAAHQQAPRQGHERHLRTQGAFSSPAWLDFIFIYFYFRLNK